MLGISAMLFIVYFARREGAAEAAAERKVAPGQGRHAAAAQPRQERRAESVVPLLSYDPMELEIGFGLIPLVDVNQGGDLLERITLIRRHAARDLGIVVPPIRVRDNLQLRPNSYVVKIYGLEVAQAEVMVSRLLAMNPGTATAPIDGIPTTEPAFGLPALWIAENARGEAEMAGYTVIDPTSVIATHLTELIKAHAPDLLGRQETSALLDNIKSHYPVVVDELVPGLLTVGEVQRVLQNLLRERIPIRNLVMILETLADAARVSKDIDFLTEKVRAALARHISAEYAENGLLSVITVDPRLESLLVRSGSPRRGCLCAARSEYRRADLHVADAADRGGAKRRFAADRFVLAVGAFGAQAAYRTRGAAIGGPLVLGDCAGPARSNRSDRSRATEETGEKPEADVQVDFRKPWGCGSTQQIATAPLFRRRGRRRPPGAFGDGRVGRRQRGRDARRARQGRRDRDPDLQRGSGPLPDGDQDRCGDGRQHPVRPAAAPEPDRRGERVAEAPERAPRCDRHR